MEIVVYGVGRYKVTSDEMAVVEERVLFAADRWQHKIDQIRVSIRDVNGPRGGSDKHCMLRVSLRDSGTKVFSEQSASVYQAISLIADKLKHSMARDKEFKITSRRKQRPNRYAEDLAA